MFFWPYVCWLDCKAQKKRKFCHKLFINSFNVKDCMNASNGRGHAVQKTIQNTVTIWYVYTFWKISRKKTTKLSRWMFTMQYRTTLTDKRKTNDKRETNNKKNYHSNYGYFIQCRMAFSRLRDIYMTSLWNGNSNKE